MTASPLKWHGGKSYLASRIVALMPKHTHFVEPFAGGLSVLLAKDPDGVSEVVNDVNLDLSNFWSVLQNRPLFEEFRRFMSVTPFSEAEYRAAGDVLAGREPDVLYTLATGIGDPAAAACVARAVAFFVRCRQSMAGRMRDFATLSRNRTRRGMNEQASAWLSAVDGLPAVHERLKRVVVLDRDALDVVRQQDGPGTLFYCDPPYLPETRTSPDVYAHEMTAERHAELLALLATVKGRFLLSGYRCPAYDAAAETHGWHRADFTLPNNASGGAEKRRMVESVWMNYVPQETAR